MTTTTEAEVAPATSNSRSFLLERVQPAMSGPARGVLTPTSISSEEKMT
jgi:hypothetical protein